jgi:hypothetical protein
MGRRNQLMMDSNGKIVMKTEKRKELPANILKEVNQIEDEILFESFQSKHLNRSYKRERALKIINNLIVHLE